MNLSGRKQGHMPVEAYTSQEWYDLEMKTIFSKSWQYAGLIEDVAESGQYTTVQAGLYNILIVRGDDHRLRAFHNLCCHRGTQLLRAHGKADKVITCPYHDWTYSLNGQLKHVPEKEKEFPDLDMSKMCLQPALVETWRGMIWVHPRPEEAPKFLDWLDGIEDYLGPHQPEALVEYEEGRIVEEINANWKIVVENYIDAYHLAHLHSETLNMYDHSKIEWRFCGNHFAFYEPLAPEYLENVESQSPLPLIDHIPRSQIGAYVPMLFPNIGLGETEGSWSTFHVIPIAPDKCMVDIRTKVMPMSNWQFTKQNWKSYFSLKLGAGDKYKTGDKDDPMASGDFMKEDIFACEQHQKSLTNPLFKVGATAKHMEKTVLGHQDRVLKMMGMENT